MAASLWMTSAPRASEQSRDAGDRAVSNLIAIIKIHLLRVAGVSLQQLWQLNSPCRVTHRPLSASHGTSPERFTLWLCKQGGGRVVRQAGTGKGHGCSADSERLTTVDALQNVTLRPLSNPPSTEQVGCFGENCSQPRVRRPLSFTRMQVPTCRCLALLSACRCQEQGGCGDPFAGMMGRS